MVAALSRLFLKLPLIFYSMASVEAMLMKMGDLVNVETFSEGRVDRRVVDTKGDTIYICTEDEWLSAQKERREPLCVGFNQRYVLPCHGNTSVTPSHGSVSNA